MKNIILKKEYILNQLNILALLQDIITILINDDFFEELQNKQFLQTIIFHNENRRP